jgi:hypothetical protein
MILAPNGMMTPRYNAERQLQNYTDNANNSLFGRVGSAANAVGNWAGQAAGNVGNAVSGAAGNAVDWARNAVGNVGNWAGNLFNRGESPSAPARSPEEQRAAQATLDRMQRSAQYMYAHPENFNYSQNAKTNSGNNAGSMENPVIIGNDPGMMGLVESLYNSNHPIFSQFRGNQQASNSRSDRLADKPDNVSDEFWEEYKYNGGTREDYDAQRAADKQMYERSKQATDSRLSDKPDNVSDDYWLEYKYNGGTREDWDARRNASSSIPSALIS